VTIPAFFLTLAFKPGTVTIEGRINKSIRIFFFQKNKNNNNNNHNGLKAYNYKNKQP